MRADNRPHSYKFFLFFLFKITKTAYVYGKMAQCTRISEPCILVKERRPRERKVAPISRKSARKSTEGLHPRAENARLYYAFSVMYPSR